MRRHHDNNRVYYRVTPGSPAMQAIDRLQAQEKTARNAVEAIRKKLRLPKKLLLMSQGRHICGFQSNPLMHAKEYVDEHPTVWRWDARQHMAFPRRTTPEGREAAKMFETHPPFVDGPALNRELVGVNKAYFSGMAIVFAGYARYYDEYVVSLPAEMVLDAKSNRQPKKQPKNGYTHDNQIPVIPEGLTEMKQSEAMEWLARLEKDDAEEEATA